MSQIVRLLQHTYCCNTSSSFWWYSYINCDSVGKPIYRVKYNAMVAITFRPKDLSMSFTRHHRQSTANKSRKVQIRILESHFIWTETNYILFRKTLYLKWKEQIHVGGVLEEISTYVAISLPTHLYHNDRSLDFQEELAADVFSRLIYCKFQFCMSW